MQGNKSGVINQREDDIHMTEESSEFLEQYTFNAKCGELMNSTLSILWCIE